jgi:hypothetical protein
MKEFREITRVEIWAQYISAISFWSSHIFHNKLFHEAEMLLLRVICFAGYPKPIMSVGLTSFGITKSLKFFFPYFRKQA